MNKWRQLVEIFRIARSDASIGDIAALKLGMFSSPNPELTAQLEALPSLTPDVTIEQLRAMPAASLGREYARFLDFNGIELFELSPEVKARFADDPFTVRYTMTHDLHHVIAGFDAGIAGEVGVAAFTIGQDVGYLGRGVLWLQALLVTCFAPAQVRAVWSNIRVGLAMGEASDALVTAPLEEWLELPLREVRARLGVSDELREQARASRPSVFAKLGYRLIGRELPELPHTV